MAAADTLHRLVHGARLSAAEAEAMLREVLAGRWEDAQIAAALALIQMRGVTFEELTGGARAMRAHATAVPTAGLSGTVIDTCGTGGAGKTFNVSTVAAIVAAAAAPGVVRVAKHGNRSRSGRGSAEVLSALGVNVDAGPEVQAACLREAGVCFCFAIHHHPAAKHAARARSALGFPTMFNLLGPLTNPAGAPCQLMGVFAERYVEPMARALAELGSTRAMVVHGRDGMDEISTTAPTIIAHVEGGGVRVEEFDAAGLGIARASLESLTAGDLSHAAAAARGVLGGEDGPMRTIVELNAAAALVVGGGAAGLAEGIDKARGAIDSGAAARTLALLARVSNGGVRTA
ncbi:MAG: anthranilate phosphoribosyltransferase [Planctomycetes bacterium]|nr:anthranilate phosphoribosyltransferase [Planctomycetota bacterium]